MIPGRFLHRLAGVFIPAATRERVIDAQLADFRYEFARAGSASQRAIVLVRGYGAFWRMFPLCGSVSWADAWNAATDMRMVANFPLVALAQYYAVTKRVSLPAVLIALLTAFGFRLLGIPEESIAHWEVRMTVCMTLVLAIPRLLRVGKPL